MRAGEIRSGFHQDGDVRRCREFEAKVRSLQAVTTEHRVPQNRGATAKSRTPSRVFRQVIKGRISWERRETQVRRVSNKGQTSGAREGENRSNSVGWW
jgi:hypothetical protein